MTFLSGETIARRLANDKIITDANDNSLFKNENVDCNSYKLSVGTEVYVTDENAKQHDIPAGHFAFILTDEVVNIPNDLMAFISMRSKMKFQGLVNVSGFHVDPGWKGRLIFAVYNAGPKKISLKKGDAIFSIWFASLDQTTEIIKTSAAQLAIPSELINNLHGNVYSPQILNEKIENLDKKIAEVEGKNKNYLVVLIVGLLIGAAAGILIDLFNNFIDVNSGYKQELKFYVDKLFEQREKITPGVKVSDLDIGQNFLDS